MEKADIAKVEVAGVSDTSPIKVNIMGMPLDKWRNGGCIAHFGVGDDFATLYDIQSSNPGKGEATELLRWAKKFYEDAGKKFGGSVALNERMKKIYQRLDIKEYE